MSPRIWQIGFMRMIRAWVSGLHISHISTFIQILKFRNKSESGLNLSNAGFFIVNCVGLTPMSLPSLSHYSIDGGSPVSAPYMNR